MKKSLAVRILTVFCCLLALSLPALSPEELAELNNRSSLKTFPEAHSVLLWDHETYRYRPDGRSEMVDECYQKALTEKGRTSLRKLSLPFNATYEQLTVEKAEVFQTDGGVRKVDLAANISIANDSSSMASNIYDPAHRILTLNVPGLQIGDVLHVIWKKGDLKVRVPGQWSDIFVLQADFPILHYQVTVHAPAALPLKSIAIKNEQPGTLTFEKKKTKEGISYRWIVKDVPQIVPEPAMPPLHRCVQRVLVSTAKDWREFSRWYWKLCRRHLDSITPDMRKKVRELTAAAKTPEEKMAAIFRFVSQQVRYMGITAETEAPGYEPHDVSLTFSNRYGVCRDKAALLVSMLELAGFNAYPTLFLVGEPKEPEVPNAFFNHAVTAVETAPGKYLLMDPTYENSAEYLPGFEANMSYLVARPEGETLQRSPLIPAEKNQLKITTSAKFSSVGSGSCTGVTQIRFSGLYDPLFRGAFARWPEERRKQFFSAALRQCLAGVELTDLALSPAEVRDISVPLQLTLHWRAGGLFPFGESSFLLPVPLFGERIGFLDALLFEQTGLEKRRFPLRLASTCSIAEKAELTLPSEFRVLSLPGKGAAALPGGVTFQRAFSERGGKLCAERNFQLNNLEFASPEYRRLKAVLREIAAKDRALPLIGSGFSQLPGKKSLAMLQQSFPEADAVVHRLDTAVLVFDRNSWEEKTEVELQVLKYAGVKRHSELAISFNPVWEEVELTGKVVQVDGKELKLSKKELNLLDAPWNSSAPRCPPGKILTAAFPGVQPGSTIHYSLRRIIKNRPFFEFQHSFAGEEPRMAQNVTIDVPESLPMEYEILSGQLPATRSRNKKRVLYRWNAPFFPRIRRESHTPPAMLFLPTLRVSSGTIEQAAELWNRELQRAAADGAEKVAAAILPRLDALPAADAVREKQLRKVQLIRDVAVKAIRIAGPAPSELPVSSIAGAGTTFSSGYGTTADRAALLGAMLKAAGIPYCFIGVCNLPPFPELLRAMSRWPAGGFDDILVYLPEQECYLNDTDEYTPLGSVGYADRLGLDLSSGRMITIRAGRKDLNRLAVDTVLTLSAEGNGILEVTFRSYGRRLGADRRFYDQCIGKARLLHYQSLAASFFPGAKLLGEPELDLAGSPGVLKMKLELPHCAPAANGFMQVPLPGYRQLANRVNTGDPDRRNPCWRSDAVRLELNGRIDLPPGAKVVSNRPERSRLGQSGSALYTEHFEVFPGSVRYDMSLNLPVKLIPAIDYDHLVQLDRKLHNLSAGNLIVKLPENPAGKDKK